MIPAQLIPRPTPVTDDTALATPDSPISFDETFSASALNLKKHSPSFSTDFLEALNGQEIPHRAPIRIGSLVRKLDNHALRMSQNPEEADNGIDVAAPAVNTAPFAANTGSSVVSNIYTTAIIDPVVPRVINIKGEEFPLRLGVLDPSDSDDEVDFVHGGLQTTKKPVVTESYNAIASPPSSTEESTYGIAETYQSIFGGSGSPDTSTSVEWSTSAEGPNSTGPESVEEGPQGGPELPHIKNTSLFTDNQETESLSSAKAYPAAPDLDANAAPDASAAIGTIPAFPRGIGCAPGENGFAGKKKRNSFNLSKVFAKKKPDSTAAPPQLTTAEKRAIAIKERNARIQAAQRAKAKVPAARTDIAPPTNPAVRRQQRVELLGRKKGHLREARAELKLAETDVKLLEESIEELEKELAEEIEN